MSKSLIESNKRFTIKILIFSHSFISLYRFVPYGIFNFDISSIVFVIHCHVTAVFVFFAYNLVAVLSDVIERSRITFAVLRSAFTEQRAFVVKKSETGNLVVGVTSGFSNGINYFFHFGFYLHFLFSAFRQGQRSISRNALKMKMQLQRRKSTAKEFERKILS